MCLSGKRPGWYCRRSSLYFKIIHNLAGSIRGFGKFNSALFLIGVTNDAGQRDNALMHIDVDI